MGRLRYWLLAGLALGAVLLIGCEDESSKTPLKARYHYSAECAYCDIRVDGSTIKHTYFEPDDRCKTWVVQSPCWTQQDLNTATGVLSNRERRELASLIGQTGFMNLKDTYGEEHEQARYYPHTLEVTVGEQAKKVVYKSRPDAPPMPDAFVKVRDKLVELAERTKRG
jgi:hypothetical protein